MRRPLPRSRLPSAPSSGAAGGVHARRPRRGLTLVELTIAIAIIAVLFSAAVIGIGAVTGAQAKSSAGELAGTIRSLYDTAALSGRTCRIVFEIPSEKEEGTPVRYHAECAQGALTTDKDRERALATEEKAREDAERERDRGRSRRSRDNLEDLMSQERDRIEKAGRFSEYTAPEVKARQLPGSVRIGVWTRNQQKVIRSGPAALYFFPQGVTERAMVFVSQGDTTWTISVAPLTGKTSIAGEELEVPRS